jgi:heterodisulfide reductase subunit A
MPYHGTKKKLAVIDQEQMHRLRGLFYAVCPEKFSAVTVTAVLRIWTKASAPLCMPVPEPLSRSAAALSGRKDCIRCGLCTMMCTKVMGIGALKMVEEGIEAGRDICQVCGACASLCPVGFP